MQIHFLKKLTNPGKLFMLTFLVLSVYACKESTNKHRPDAETGSASVQQPKETHLIIPGKKMGDFEVDGNANAILDTFQKPGYSDAAMGKVLLKWNRVLGDSLFMFNTQQMGIEDFKRIKVVRSFSSAFRTEDNVGVGSSLTAIKKHFSAEEKGIIKEGGDTYRLFMDTKGIGFEMTEDDICRAVIVYSKDFPPPNSYLPFYADYEEYIPD